MPPTSSAGDLVLLGHGDDVHRPQQSIRTFFNTSAPERNYVKTALSVLNMGFLRGLSAAYMEVTPAINDHVADLVRGDETLRSSGFDVLREHASVGYRSATYDAVAEKGDPHLKMLAGLWRESPVPLLREGETLATIASLLHVDEVGESFAAALVETQRAHPGGVGASLPRGLPRPGDATASSRTSSSSCPTARTSSSCSRTVSSRASS